MYGQKLLWWIAFIEIFVSAYLKAQRLTIFESANYKGLKLSLNVTGCTNIPNQLNDKLSSLNTHGQCFLVFENRECKGNKIEIHPGSPSHHYLGNWDFNDRASSVSPCGDSCTEVNNSQQVASRDTKNLTVFLFTDNDYKGHYMEMFISGCTTIPQEMKKRVSSIRTNNSCVQLYDDNYCKGNSIQVKPHYPNHNRLWDWGFSDKAVSISPCYLNCGDNQNPPPPIVTIPAPRDNQTITIFDEKDYAGLFLQLKVENCTQIYPKLWEAFALSIKVYGRCYELYEYYGCKGKRFVMDRVDANNLADKNFDGIARCVQPCPALFYKPLLIQVPTQDYGVGGLKPWISIAVVACVLVLCSGIIIYFFWRHSKRQKKLIETLTEKDIEEFRYGNVNSLAENEEGHSAAYSMPFNENYEIPKNCIQFDKKSILGIGQSAIVYKGYSMWTGRQHCVEVAVKTVKPSADAQYLKSLLKEVKVMMYIEKHPRIVELIGCCTRNIQNYELYIVLEYCSNGSLDKFLQKHRHDFFNIGENYQIARQDCGRLAKHSYANVETTVEVEISTADLMEWSRQICEGMEFLASKKVIHGDLATRNVLLQSDLTAKISDFGLSRQLYQYTQYVKGKEAPLPWRWMAIESLRDLKFSTESDVWSFGITLWEIFTLAEAPYPGLVWSTEFMTSLLGGMRLPKPEYATSDIYNTMLSCWMESPSERPSFSEIRRQLLQVVETSFTSEVMKDAFVKKKLII